MVLQTKSTVILFLFLSVLMVSCGGGPAKLPVVSIDPDKVPMIHAENINSLVSDSGITRYRIKAKVWDMYSNAKEPFWLFPKGIYVERFDSLLNVEGHISADTAYYYEQKELWRAVGNVRIQNLQGDCFETSELFLNMKEHPDSRNCIYSDKPVKLIQKGLETISRGVRSNRAMTDCITFEMSGEAEFEDSMGGTPRTDSTSVPPSSSPSVVSLPSRADSSSIPQRTVITP